jgi:hypothetical protein
VGESTQQFTRRRYAVLTAESTRAKLSIDEVRSSRVVRARLSCIGFQNSVPIQCIYGTAHTVGVHAYSVPREVLLQRDAGKGRKGT